jgi:hypothetical protein
MTNEEIAEDKKPLIEVVKEHFPEAFTNCSELIEELEHLDKIKHTMVLAIASRPTLRLIGIDSVVRIIGLKSLFVVVDEDNEDEVASVYPEVYDSNQVCCDSLDRRISEVIDMHPSSNFDLFSVFQIHRYSVSEEEGSVELYKFMSIRTDTQIKEIISHLEKTELYPHSPYSVVKNAVMDAYGDSSSERNTHLLLDAIALKHDEDSKYNIYLLYPRKDKAFREVMAKYRRAAMRLAYSA